MTKETPTAPQHETKHRSHSKSRTSRGRGGTFGVPELCGAGLAGSCGAVPRPAEPAPRTRAFRNGRRRNNPHLFHVSFALLSVLKRVLCQLLVFDASPSLSSFTGGLCHCIVLRGIELQPLHKTASDCIAL